MEHFTQLFMSLDQTTKTTVKVGALTHYLEVADDADKLWTLALLTGKRPKRPVNTTRLKEWACELAEIPYWLFEETYHVVGDLAETISHLVPHDAKPDQRSLAEWMLLLQALKEEDEARQKAIICQAWAALPQPACFVFNKLMTGGFRMGVSQKLMVRALAKHTGKAENELAHRLMGDWKPTTTTYQKLIWEQDAASEQSRPYPFFLAYPLEGHPEQLGSPADWLAERKWDGIRGQLIARNGEVFVWSRGEELVTDKFPELTALNEALPQGTVIDGEILAYQAGKPLPFQHLQTRIGRKNVTKAILQKVPVVLMAYDLLEAEGQDLRAASMQARRERLEQLVARADHPHLLLSPLVAFEAWPQLARERAQSRQHLAEGIMLKRRESPYRTGRKRGDWWKWKVEPLVIDAVMIYAMRGHGRRANLYSDYTFAVWQGEELIPFTKAYSGLTDAEMRQVDAFVKKNTLERFGPVRSVKPELVFEIAFEGIAKSGRHKSGVALRFPRINRWRQDKPAEEANTMDDLLAILANYGGE